MTCDAEPDWPMEAGERREFESRLAMLPETAAFVEGFCARNQVDRATMLRLVLIVEELVTNTVTHGHGEESGSPVTLTLARVPGGVNLLYEDRARPFDPSGAFARSRSPLAAEPEARYLGRLGLRLVGRMIETARYNHAAGCNRLWLRVRSAG